jgi:uncharacterized tellurite resistance protein B-like protein
MHIVLAFLGSVVTILILLSRLAEMGIDLGGLNPFLLYRRKKWKNQIHGNPIYHIDSPMEMVALLMVAVAKSSGDMSSEEKRKILDLFTSEFHLSKKDAAALMIASVYLLRDGSDLREHMKKVVEKSLKKFTEEQADSAFSLINEVANLDRTGNPIKEELVKNIEEHLQPVTKSKQKWN